jgi:hypothetical protein
MVKICSRCCGSNTVPASSMDGPGFRSSWTHRATQGSRGDRPVPFLPPSQPHRAMLAYATSLSFCAKASACAAAAFCKLSNWAWQGSRKSNRVATTLRWGLGGGFPAARPP